ncbi:MAG: hypothetical protein PHD83_01900 [Caldisericia bacterium]|nr:hypothetical protein [Caldisericia bacterium]
MWGIPLLTFLSFIAAIITVLVASIWAFISNRNEETGHQEGEE